MNKRHKVTIAEREAILDYIYSSAILKKEILLDIKKMNIKQRTLSYWIKKLTENPNFKSRFMK